MKVYLTKTSHYILILGVTLLLSVLFQIYWTNIAVFDGVLYVKGGGLQRFLLKIVALFLIFVSLYKFFSVKALLYNFALKIPLIYYILTVIVVFPFTYTNAYIQAVNLVLFIPILCLDFSGKRGEEIFTELVKIIVWVVCLQLAVDLFLKAFGLNLVITVLGGMGNANTFGLHLIVAGLGLRFIYKQHLLSNIILLFTLSTGSFACVVVGFALVFQSLIINLWRNSIGVVFLISGIYTSVFFGWSAMRDAKYGAVYHAYMKIEGFIEFLFYGGSVESAGGSFVGRGEYTMQGLNLLNDNPLSIVFGHPNFMPFYSGDGFYIALAVTLGIPMMALFTISNLYTIFRGLRENTALSNFAAYTLIVFVVFFGSNRILDYWPSGFVYALAISYLLRNKIPNIINFNRQRIKNPFGQFRGSA